MSSEDPMLMQRSVPCLICLYACCLCASLLLGVYRKPGPDRLADILSHQYPMLMQRSVPSLICVRVVSACVAAARCVPQARAAAAWGHRRVQCGAVTRGGAGSSRAGEGTHGERGLQAQHMICRTVEVNSC
jgi:hypothetical protein